MSKKGMHVRCGCGMVKRVDANKAGRRFKCPSCGKAVRVPYPQHWGLDPESVQYDLEAKGVEVIPDEALQPERQHYDYGDAVIEDSPEIKCPQCGQVTMVGLTEQAAKPTALVCPKCGHKLSLGSDQQAGVQPEKSSFWSRLWMRESQ